MDPNLLFQRIWIYPPREKKVIEQIITEFNIHPITAQILFTRGYRDFDQIHSFLYAKLPNLYAPELFKAMHTATQRILLAIHRKESILIYGDNDVDGMTATALLTDFLRALHAHVLFYIPNRSIFKKSFIKELLEFRKQNGCSLIITVDCSFTSSEDLRNISEASADFIITDHHELMGTIPQCLAILNPKLPSSSYPNRNLTGVGVAFKLAHGLLNQLTESGKTPSVDLKSYLDLVALGTIADMGPLHGENRVLVRYGLKQMRQTTRIGLAKLLQQPSFKMTPTEIASKIAPRLNSLGRIADPMKGVELLLTQDPLRADQLISQLELCNTARQAIERKTSEEITEYLSSHPELLQEKAIVLASNTFHPGIVPILTSRIAKHYCRPTAIISLENGIGKGSIRTIPEFPLLSMLQQNRNILINFGGHDYAAGLSIHSENIPTFQKSFLESAQQCLKSEDLISKVYLDSETNFSDLTFEFMESLSLLEPFGHENPPPLLYCDAKQTWLPKNIGKVHLKLFLEQDQRALEAIALHFAPRKNYLRNKKNVPLRIAFTPTVTLFESKASIQLQIKAIRSEDCQEMGFD